jgi:hypothetical protein
VQKIVAILPKDSNIPVPDPTPLDQQQNASVPLEYSHDMLQLSQSRGGETETEVGGWRAHNVALDRQGSYDIKSRRWTFCNPSGRTQPSTRCLGCVLRFIRGMP